MVLTQQNSTCQLILMGTGGDGGHTLALAELTGWLPALPVYFRLLWGHTSWARLVQPLTEEAAKAQCPYIYEKSTPVRPALKRKTVIVEDWTATCKCVHCASIHRRCSFCVFPLPSTTLLELHTALLYVSSPQVALLFTVLPTLSPLVLVKWNTSAPLLFNTLLHSFTWTATSRLGST